MQNTLSFINDEAKSIHGSLKLSSVFIGQSGEWRLGGFEVLSSMTDDDAVIYVSTISLYIIWMLLINFLEDIWKSRP